MSDVAAALLQLIGRTEPAADPALVAVKLARASLDALVLRLGQSIDAKVTAQLTGGLTQLTAGGETFVLKLETPLPVNTAVTLKIAPTPTGQPAVTVTVQSPPVVVQPAPPAPQPLASLPSLPQSMAPPPTTGPVTVPGATQSAPPAPLPSVVPPIASPPAPVAAPPVAPAPLPATQIPQPPPVPPAPVTSVPPIPTPAIPTPLPATPPTTAMPPLPQATPPAGAVGSVPAPAAPPAPAQAMPAATTPAPLGSTAGASTTVALPMPVATSARPAIAPTPQTTLAAGVPAVPIASSPEPLPAQTAMVSPAPLAPRAPTPAMPAAAPPPASAPVPPGMAPQAAVPAAAVPLPSTMPISPTVRLAPSPPASPPLAQILADPVQAAARQDSVLPLIVRLATLTAPTAAALPRPAVEALAMLLGTRLDLNRAPPDGKAVRDAVLRAGVITEPGTRTPSDAKSALLQLRSALSGFLGGAVDAVAPVTRRPPPPLKGEPVRAPSSQPAAPLPDEPSETARQLLGHADAALSRTKLLQLASNPVDAARPAVAAPAAEFRVEVPMQLGAETGILQLLVERDGKHKRTPAERGWRMRFALNFTATGEVGAEVVLFGRSANVSLWAVDPATADALEAMLPELAPALARHGLDVGAVRLRRGAPQPAARVPGQLLDSAR
jgi:hypothetical protein